MEVRKGRTVVKRLLSWIGIAVFLFSSVSYGLPGGFVKAQEDESAISISSSEELEASYVSEQLAGDPFMGFVQEYAAEGQLLETQLHNVPSDAQVSYEWFVGGNKISNKTSAYTPAHSDLEKLIQVKAVVKGIQQPLETSLYFSTLPVIYIDTENHAPIVGKEDQDTLPAKMKVQGNDRYNSVSTTLYDGGISIRGRGNSTWGWPKKPYKVKLDDKTDMFGFGSSKHWVLLANYIDHSFMRNQLTNELSGDLGMGFYAESADVVLILNGSYDGLYSFGEQIRVDKERVDIYNWEGTAEDAAKAIKKKDKLTSEQQDELEEQMVQDLSWASTDQVTFHGKTYQVSEFVDYPRELTGGYLLEMDMRLDEISNFRTKSSIPIMFSSPEYAKTNDRMMTYVRDYIQAYENAVQAEDFTTKYNGRPHHYSQLFDFDSSLANWMLVEYTLNWDGMKNSTYMYKPVDEPIKMGPAWDFDWIWGNLNPYNLDANKPETWQTTNNSFWDNDFQRNGWNISLFKDPYFAVQAYELYQKIRPTLMEDIMKEGGKIDEKAEYLRTAANADLKRWEGTWSNNRMNFNQAVAQMKDFLTIRLNWMDKQFASPEKLLQSWGKYTESDKIRLTGVIRSADTKETQITVAISDNTIKKTSFQVNGTWIKEASVKNGTAVILVPDSALTSKAGGLNTVQFRGMDSKGNYIKIGQQVVSSFGTFTTDITEELIGEVSIYGNPTVGNTVTASLSNTNNTGTLAWQWMADGEPISGALSSQYQLSDSDIGKRITVVIASTEQSGTLTSQAVGPVTQKKENENENQKPNPPAVIEVDKITLNKADVILLKSKSLQLTFAVTPSNAINQTPIWTTSNPKVAAVDNKGKITAKGKGTAIIQARTQNGKMAVCKVTVPQVTLNASAVSLQVKQTTNALVIKNKYPSSDKVVNWKSSNKKYITVNSKTGKIKAIKPGKATITLYMKSGASATCKITVKKTAIKYKALTPAKKHLSLKKGKSVQINIKKNPITANEKISYQSNNAQIASVSKSGKVKGLKKGSTYIRITTPGGKSAKVQVSIK